MTQIPAHALGTAVHRVLVRRTITTGVDRPHVTTTRRLLTDAWTSAVAFLEATVRRLDEESLAGNPCEVAFFEIVHDRQLHVNVMHQFLTRTAPGWAGPAHVPGGFVHNRRFAGTARSRIARNIRAMVLASPIESTL